MKRFILLMFLCSSVTTWAKSFKYVGTDRSFSFELNDKGLAYSGEEKRLFLEISACNRKMIESFWADIKKLNAKFPKLQADDVLPYSDFEGERRWAVTPQYAAQVRHLDADFHGLLFQVQQKCGR